jgi:hypothetical protein
MPKNAGRHWHRISSCSAEFFSERGIKPQSPEFLALAVDFCARKQRGMYGSLDMTSELLKNTYFIIVVIHFGLVATEYRKYIYGLLPVQRGEVMHPEQVADGVL